MSRKVIKGILFVLGLVMFILLGLLVVSDNISSFDELIYSMIVSIECEPITMLCKLLSFFCSPFFLIGFMLLIIILAKDKKKVFYICLNIGLCCLINQCLKFMIHRDRPIGINLVIQNGYSFPSGHSMVSFAFYGFMIYLMNSEKESRKIRKNTLLYSTLLGCLILCIGLSRIYLGVHYASDVLAGFSLSLSYLIIYIYMYEKRITKK